MMHKQSFVLSIKDSHQKILREVNGQVFLPFNSEYQLLLKNLNYRRAVCQVTIDGTDALGGQELIVEANSSVDLERFMVDGNMSSGQRFKFVPLSSSEVQDTSSSENGIVVARFWLERPPVGWTEQMYPAGMMKCCCDSMSTPTLSQAGATVAGSHSNQGFSHGYFGEKDLVTETVLSLKLCGQVNQPVTVEQTRAIHCGFCGTRNKYQANFCGKCGKELSSMKVTL